MESELMKYEYENVKRLADPNSIKVDIDAHATIDKGIVSLTWHEDMTLIRTGKIPEPEDGISVEPDTRQAVLIIEWGKDISATDKIALDGIVAKYT